MLTKLLADKHAKNFQVYDIDGSHYVEQTDLERWAKNLAKIRGLEPETSEYKKLVEQFIEIWRTF